MTTISYDQFRGLPRFVAFQARFLKNSIIAAVLLLLPGLSGALADVVSDDEGGVVRLAPLVRLGVSSSPVQARQTLPVAPLLLDAGQLAQAPRIVATPDRRLLVGKGDHIAVAGDLHGVTEFRVVRPSRRLLDPLSGEHLGDEVIVLGKAVLQRGDAAGAHSFIVVSSTQEITFGDLLYQPAPAAAPHLSRPAVHAGAAVDARIISIADGAVHAAQHQVVGINKGARDDVVAGMSLTLIAVPRPSPAARKNTQQQASGSPGNESGRLLIFRVHDRVSYGLITESVEALQVGDKAFAPSTKHTSIDHSQPE
jgi:hypothetical protein